MGLTIKQEKFCHEYIRTGNKSEAYRFAYKTENMKPATINRKAVELCNHGKVSARVENLRNEIAERNKINIDECVSILAKMARFDVADMYEDDGTLKSIHNIPEETRLAITELSVFEEFEGTGKDRVFVGFTKKTKTESRRAVLIELMKHLGGYEKDNTQKAAPNFVVFDGRKKE